MRVSVPEYAPSNRTALATIASNTGCTSVCELTDDAQDVTGRRLCVERRRQVTIAGLEFFEQPHVLDRDHRLVGEGLEQRDLVVSESPGLAAGHRDRSDNLVMPEHGHGALATKATNLSIGVRRFRQPGIGMSIRDIERRTVANGLSMHPSGTEGLRKGSPGRSVTCVVRARVRGQFDLIANDAGQRARTRSEQADGARSNGIQHGLQLARRLGNDSQNVRGGRLPIERHGEIPVARLQLLEQAHVLDGDDGLVGEGLEQRDLLVREGIWLEASELECTDGCAFAQ